MRQYRWLLLLTLFALLCATLEWLFSGLPTWFVQVTGALNIVVPLLLLSAGLRIGRGAGRRVTPLAG